MNALAILEGASLWLPPMPSAWDCAGVIDGKVSRAKPPAASAQNVLREESDGAVIGPFVSPLVAGWQRTVIIQAHSEGGALHPGIVCSPFPPKNFSLLYRPRVGRRPAGHQFPPPMLRPSLSKGYFYI